MQPPNFFLFSIACLVLALGGGGGGTKNCVLATDNETTNSSSVNSSVHSSVNNTNPPTQAPTRIPFAVVRFALVDADLNTYVPGYEDLHDGVILDRALLPPQLTIEAITEPQEISEVNFLVDDDLVRNEMKYPYSLSGDHEGNFHPSTGSDLEPTGVTKRLTGVPIWWWGFEGTRLEIQYTVIDSDADVTIPMKDVAVASNEKQRVEAWKWALLVVTCLVLFLLIFRVGCVCCRSGILSPKAGNQFKTATNNLKFDACHAFEDDPTEVISERECSDHLYDYGDGDDYTDTEDDEVAWAGPLPRRRDGGLVFV